MNIQFRQAKESDLSYVTWLHHETLREYITAIWGWDELKQDKFVRNWFRPERIQIIQDGGEDIGLLVVEEQSEQYFLESISINPELQGKGFGAAVCKILMGKAVSAGLPLRLQVLKTNPDAKRFYEKLGFQEWATTENHFQMEFVPK